MNARNLLIVDDQPETVDYVRRTAEAIGYKVSSTSESSKFMEMYRALHPDTIVMAILMPDVDGIELIRELAREHCQSRLLLISGPGEFNLNSAAKLAGDYGLSVMSMSKPIRARKLRDFLCDAGVDFECGEYPS